MAGTKEKEIIQDMSVEVIEKDGSKKTVHFKRHIKENGIIVKYTKDGKEIDPSQLTTKIYRKSQK